MHSFALHAILVLFHSVCHSVHLEYSKPNVIVLQPEAPCEQSIGFVNADGDDHELSTTSCNCIAYWSWSIVGRTAAHHESDCTPSLALHCTCRFLSWSTHITGCTVTTRTPPATQPSLCLSCRATPGSTTSTPIWAAGGVNLGGCTGRCSVYYGEGWGTWWIEVGRWSHSSKDRGGGVEWTASPAPPYRWGTAGLHSPGSSSLTRGEAAGIGATASIRINRAGSPQACSSPAGSPPLSGGTTPAPHSGLGWSPAPSPGVVMSTGSPATPRAAHTSAGTMWQ